MFSYVSYHMKYICLIFIFAFLSPVYAQEVSYDSRKSHFIIENNLGENTEYETPFYILRSDKEYPKIVIDACIHGDEVAGALACDSVLKYLNVIEGTVVLIPRVNIKSYNQGTREVNIDLNQVFPGNFKSEIYEDRLAYDFMKLIEELVPDIVVNLHEAWTRFNEKLYERQKDKSFGQVIITNNDTIPFFLRNVLANINSRITNKENIFRIQYFPYKPNHSMDNIIEKLKTPSFTIETLRTLPLDERIEYQIFCILAFLEERGIVFTYNK